MSGPSLTAGASIGRRYTITKLIGQGGMGEVYEAIGPNQEIVALKILHKRALADADIVARFKREAEIASKIRSPYVARVLAAGKEPDGRLWIAFERLHGEGLDARVKREHYLSMSDVVPIVSDTLKGLQTAHEAGIVHRDIKPANLFVEQVMQPGQVRPDTGEIVVAPLERTRILDFGVSKVKSPSQAEASLTAFDATLGSFAYMAPEQVRGSARVDARADLYAVGAVCFRALAGRLPYEGTTAVTLVALKLDKDPPSLAAVTGEEWPSAIETFLQTLMARERERRYESAKEALAAWEAIHSGVPKLRAERKRTRNPESEDEVTQITQSTYTGD
jgi:eukaryotic-like serine/threonine-protein kinase